MYYPFECCTNNFFNHDRCDKIASDGFQGANEYPGGKKIYYSTIGVEEVTLLPSLKNDKSKKS